MKLQPTLFIGNDINNLVPGQSWSDLLKKLQQYCEINGIDTDAKTKPFPMLYEEIYLKSLSAGIRSEKEIKRFIADIYREGKRGPIHNEIMSLKVKNIITTNYDFNFEGAISEGNEGVIDERLYSIFRHSAINGKNIWHAHGDCWTPFSINLGYEHYSGQLQQLRNYVATGTSYQTTRLPKSPLISRLRTGTTPLYSWADLFFSDDIYIFGFSLDFVEADMLWLLTYRARQILTKRVICKNKIYYFIPTEYVKGSKAKLDLLKANQVNILDHFSGKPKDAYYHSILQYLKSEL